MRCKMECKKLRRVLDTIEPLSNELVVNVKDGWHIKAVDPAHVAMGVVEIDPSYFDEYVGSEDEVVAVDLGNLRKFLGLVKSDDMVDLETGNERLVVVAGKLSRKFTQIGPGVDNVRMPGIQYPARFAVDGGLLVMAGKAAADISDHLEVSISEGAVRFKGHGDTDEVELSSMLEYKGDGYRSLFPLDYFTSLARALPPGEVEVKMGNDLPLCLVFDDGEGLSGTYMLAPRIESE